MLTATLHNEKFLFEQIAEGDQQAFRHIFDIYNKVLFSTAIKLTKSQLASEEITQEVFISLWVSRAHLRKVDNPGSYLFRILYNKLNSYLKKESNQERLVAFAMQWKEVSANATQDAVDGNETRRRINEVIGTLPPQQKAVYLLSHLHGLKKDEIAEKLHISPHTVKSHLSKATETIRTHLKNVAFVMALLSTF